MGPRPTGDAFAAIDSPEIKRGLEKKKGGGEQERGRNQTKTWGKKLRWLKSGGCVTLEMWPFHRCKGRVVNNFREKRRRLGSINLKLKGVRAQPKSTKKILSPKKIKPSRGQKGKIEFWEFNGGNSQLNRLAKELGTGGSFKQRRS